VQTWQPQKYTVKVPPHGAAEGVQTEGARLRWLVVCLGIADRHLHLALALRDLQTLEGGEAPVQFVLETCGAERMDAGRLEYYAKLAALC
jgi:aminoglycoside phosphotransferase